MKLHEEWLLKAQHDSVYSNYTHFAIRDESIELNP